MNIKSVVISQSETSHWWKLIQINYLIIKNSKTFFYLYSSYKHPLGRYMFWCLSVWLSIVLMITPKVMNRSSWNVSVGTTLPKEQVITFWERSRSYSEYKKKTKQNKKKKPLNFQKCPMVAVCTLWMVSAFSLWRKNTGAYFFSTNNVNNISKCILLLWRIVIK